MKYSQLRSALQTALTDAASLRIRAGEAEAKLSRLKDVHITALGQRVEGHLLRYQVHLTKRHLRMLDECQTKLYIRMTQGQALGAFVEALIDTEFVTQRRSPDWDSYPNGEVELVTFELKVAK